MHRMRKGGTLVGALVTIAFLGCGDEASPGEFTATYYLSDLAGKPKVDFIALFDDWPHMLPSMGSIAPLSVNNVPLSAARGSASTPFSVADIPRLQPGEAYECVIDLPWAPDATSTVEMVHPAELTAPAAGATISLDQDLVVTWSGAAPDETDRIYLRVLAAGPAFGLLYSAGAMPPEDASDAAVAPAGASELTVPASILQRWVTNAGLPLEPATGWELVLSRSRTAPSEPASAEGRISLAAEISTIPVVFER